MNNYLIYIKSHCEAPDYEDWVVAGNKTEAVKYFLNRINQGSEDPFGEDEIYKMTAREYKNGRIK